MASYSSAHAHPLTPPRDDHTVEHPLAIDFPPWGLGAGRANAADVYCPQIRRSSLRNEFPVNHLDVVTCWKGLSLDQAKEVAIWERIFCDALEAQISNSISDHCLASSRSYSDPPRLTRYMEVDLSRLVHEMIALYYSRLPAWQRARTWFMSNGDLPAMAYNFARTRDCFLEASWRPYVQVDLTYTRSSIFVEVIWQPPHVYLNKIPHALPPGATYTLHLVYFTPDLGNARGPYFKRFPDDIEFEAHSKNLPLKWHHPDESFRAVVPAEVDVTSADPVAEYILIAKATMTFPGDVRFERISRYKIKLHITNREGPQCVDGASPANPPSTIANFDVEHDRESMHKKRKAEKQVPIDSLFDTTPSFQVDRLALDSLDEHRGLELTAKRQRLIKRVDPASHPGLPDDPSSAVQATIRQNYEEFCRKARASAPALDLDASEETREFEKIFMGDSGSEWASVADCSSELECASAGTE